MEKPYEVQADGAAPKWTKYTRRFKDKRGALRAATARVKRGLDAGPIVVYDLRRPGTNVAICEWRRGKYVTGRGVFRQREYKTPKGHGGTHAVCRIFQPMRRRSRR